MEFEEFSHFADRANSGRITYGSTTEKASVQHLPGSWIRFGNFDVSGITCQSAIDDDAAQLKITSPFQHIPLEAFLARWKQPACGSSFHTTTTDDAESSTTISRVSTTDAGNYPAPDSATSSRCYNYPTRYSNHQPGWIHRTATVFGSYSGATGSRVSTGFVSRRSISYSTDIPCGVRGSSKRSLCSRKCCANSCAEPGPRPATTEARRTATSDHASARRTSKSSRAIADGTIRSIAFHCNSSVHIRIQQ